jgi:hypothetical protein
MMFKVSEMYFEAFSQDATWELLGTDYDCQSLFYPVGVADGMHFY